MMSHQISYGLEGGGHSPSSSNISNSSMMNSSIDEFLAEYFGPAYREEHYGVKAANDPLAVGQAPPAPMGNFDLGGDDLMNSIIEENTSLESLPLPMSMLQLHHLEEDGRASDKKIVNIRTRRKSVSYDIIFNETHAVQIRIMDTAKKETGIKDNRVQLLEDELEACKLRNAELEKEIEILKEKVQIRDEAVQRLEVELAQIYMFA